MLGRLKRTTRLDVGLALSFAGIAFLVWALVAGVSRAVVQEMIRATGAQSLPRMTYLVKVFFMDMGFVIDLVGLAWLVGSLLLVVLSSRQRISVSWAWLAAIVQMMVAALGAVLVSWATYQPHVLKVPSGSEGHWQKLSQLSLPVVVALALLIWVTFLVWLLLERARFNRHGPSLRDGLRSNVYR